MCAYRVAGEGLRRGSGGFGFSFSTRRPASYHPSHAQTSVTAHEGALSRVTRLLVIICWPQRAISTIISSVDTFGGTVATHAVSVGHRAWPRGFVYWPGPGPRAALCTHSVEFSTHCACFHRHHWSDGRSRVGTRVVSAPTAPTRTRATLPWQSRGLLKPRRNATPMPWPVADSTGAEALRQERCTMP